MVRMNDGEGTEKRAKVKEKEIDRRNAVFFYFFGSLVTLIAIIIGFLLHFML